MAGDVALVRRLLEVRKHAGMIVPWPVQRAMVAALGDDAHVAEQKQRYASRRASLRETLERAGFRIDASEAGLYLWSTRGEDAWASVAWLAERGVLVAPGTFYGAQRRRSRHVRGGPLTGPTGRGRIARRRAERDTGARLVRSPSVTGLCGLGRRRRIQTGATAR